MTEHHHNLLKEFPGQSEKIQLLKTQNEHFKKLADQYAELDKSIYRAEQRIDVLSEEAEHSLKQERVALKDAISEFLQK